MSKYEVYRVNITEAERGWGQRKDGQILGMTSEKVIERFRKMRENEGQEFAYLISTER